LAPLSDSLGRAGAENRHFQHVHVAGQAVHVQIRHAVAGLLYIDVE
jgi:hypothetical protein